MSYHKILYTIKYFIYIYIINFIIYIYFIIYIIFFLLFFKYNLYKTFLGLYNYIIFFNVYANSNLNILYFIFDLEKNFPCNASMTLPSYDNFWIRSCTVVPHISYFFSFTEESSVQNT